MAGFGTIVGLLLLAGCIGWVYQLFNQEEGMTYNASFGDEHKYLSRWNKGWAVTGLRSTTRELARTNCAVFGPTGSGKSSTIIISSCISLARGMSTVIVNDISGEVWDAVSGYLYSLGYRLFKFNFADFLHSERFNPLEYCKTISDIQKTALLIIRNTIGESKSDPYWENMSIILLGTLLRYLVFHAELKYRTMQNALLLLERFAYDPKSVDKLFAATMDADLLNSYKATITLSDKTMSSVVSTLRTALAIWIDPAVCATTSCNTIDLNDLRSKPVAIFLNTPLNDLAYYRPISALFIQSLFNSVLSRIPANNERDIFFVLDEFNSYVFPNFVTTISNIRKYAGMLICMQDEQALISRYGVADAHQIKTNAGVKVYLKGQPLQTCQSLSQILGKYSFVPTGSSTEKQRELLTVDELRVIDDSIIIINNQLPLRCKMVPYFKNRWIRKYTSMPPYQPAAKEIVEPALIQFT